MPIKNHSPKRSRNGLVVAFPVKFAFLKEMKISITKLHFVLTYCITLCQFKKKTYVI